MLTKLSKRIFFFADIVLVKLRLSLRTSKDKLLFNGNWRKLRAKNLSVANQGQTSDLLISSLDAQSLRLTGTRP